MGNAASQHPEALQLLCLLELLLQLLAFFLGKLTLGDIPHDMDIGRYFALFIIKGRYRNIKKSILDLFLIFLIMHQAIPGHTDNRTIGLRKFHSMHQLATFAAYKFCRR